MAPTLAERLRLVPISRLRARLRLAQRIIDGDDTFGSVQASHEMIERAKLEAAAIEAELSVRGEDG